MKKSDKILVTGAASGFIGSRLVKHLYENGFTNLRTTSYSRELREHHDGVEHLQGNLQDADFVRRYQMDVDVVFQRANTSNALDTKVNPLLHVTPNVEMNTNLMEQSWRNKVRKFIFISSNTTYPDVGGEYCTEDMEVLTPNIYPVYKQ